jgi:hypothetical protein
MMKNQMAQKRPAISQLHISLPTHAMAVPVCVRKAIAANKKAFPEIEGLKRACVVDAEFPSEVPQLDEPMEWWGR